MKKSKMITLILILVGLIFLILGILSLNKNEKKVTEDKFMLNTTQFFDGITCYNNLCLSNLKISNSSTKDTEVEFDLTNNNKTTVTASKLGLRFDTGDKISFSYKNLNSNETVKIKVKTKNNLSEVMTYKLERD